MTSGGYEPNNDPRAGQAYGQPPPYQPGGPYAPPPGPPPGQPHAQYPLHEQFPPPQPGQPQPYTEQPPPPEPPYQQTVYPQPQYGGSRYGQFEPTFGMPGSTGLRFLARVIDNLIIALPLGIALNFVLIPNVTGFGGVALSYAIVFAVLFAYYVILESRTGATLGKRITGLKVVAPDGAPTVPLPATLKRNIYLALAIIPCLGWLAAFALTIYMFATMDKDPNKRGWHDKFAGGTQVLVP